MRLQNRVPRWAFSMPCLTAVRQAELLRGGTYFLPCRPIHRSPLQVAEKYFGVPPDSPTKAQPYQLHMLRIGTACRPRTQTLKVILRQATDRDRSARSTPPLSIGC